MRVSKVVSVLLILLALAVGTAAVMICFFAVNQEPILLSQPQEALTLAETLMDSVSEGDFEAAGKTMQGSPDLGVHREPEEAVGKLLWKAFLDSFTYELKGQCYAVDSGMALDVTVTYLDFDSVISTLGDRTGKLLEQKVHEAEDPNEIYDEKNEYRQELVTEMLLKAADEALKTEAKTVTEDLTIRMVYEQNRWQVIPDPQLIHVISGGTAG